MPEKKKFKFTFIDLLVLVVIVAVAVFVGSKLLGDGGNASGGGVVKTYMVSYFFEEVPDFAAEAIEVGEVATDEANNIELGEIKSVEVADSVSYATNQDGKWVVSSREGYKSVKLSVEVTGEEFAHGVKVEKGKYVIGHSMTLYAGRAKLYGKVSDVKEIK